MLKRKVVCSLLIATLLASAAACGSKSEDSSTTTAPATATESAANNNNNDTSSNDNADTSADTGTDAETSDEAGEPEQLYDELGFPIDANGNRVEGERIYVAPFELRPAKDMGGETLIVDAWWLDFDWERDWPDDDPGTKTFKTLLVEAQERYNCSIEYTVSAWGENVEKLTASVLAGDPYCDLIRLENRQAIPSAVGQGLLMALDDLPDYIDVETEVTDYVKTVGSFQGKQYGYLPDTEVMGDCLFFNVDILEELGLENPLVLMKNNQWTWEKFLEMCKAATKIGADGTTERYGITASDHQLALFLMMSNDGKMVDEDNNLFVGDNKNTLEALEFYQRLGSEGVVLADGAERDNFLAGKALFFPQGSFFAGNIQEQGIRFSYVPLPKGPSNTSGYSSVSGGPNMYFVPKGANYEMLTIYQESRREAIHFSSYDPDQWAEAFSYDEDAFELLTSMRDNYFTNRMERSNAFGIRQIIPWADMLTGAAQPASTIESIKSQAQTLIDNFFAGN